MKLIDITKANKPREFKIFGVTVTIKPVYFAYYMSLGFLSVLILPPLYSAFMVLIIVTIFLLKDVRKG